MKQLLLAGSVATIAGALIVALALGIIPAPESSFHAPHWVVGAAGLSFMLAGAAILAPLAIARIVPDDEQTPAQQKAIKLIQQFLACLLLTAFASIWCWVGFGPGERAFSSSVSFVGITSSGASSETTGRVIFGGVGVLIGIWATYAWFSLLRTALRIMSGEDNM